MYFYRAIVAGDHTSRQFFTYESPNTVKIGSIVEVPFGKKYFPAIVLSVVKKPTFKTKKIVQIFDEYIPLSNLDLLEWLINYYPYDYGELAKLFIPPNLQTKSRQIQTEQNTSNLPQDLPINDEQSQALEILANSGSAILHGVTGSGKTNVFLHLAKEHLKNGKNIMLLTPEIGLTPQLIEQVKKYLSYPVLVMHSRLTPAQKKVVWQKCLNSSENYIIIGPRSSLFLPVKNLGLIVCDEAHDTSYKNSSSPRYHGIIVASKIAKIHNAQLILSTATPNVIDYAIFQQKKLPIISLQQIAAGSKKSHGQLIDMTKQENFTKSKLLSNQLIEAIQDCIREKQQSLLFINRRGTARFIQCASCGFVAECPNCAIALTLHHDQHQMVCHQCNYRHNVYMVCPECQNTELLFTSPGTKGIELELSSLFPKAKIARFDLDTKAKESLASRYQEILDSQVDIILGTQIISKGLDLPNLALVGVINADSALQIPDFSAEETTFHQLYQVTGRVGRGHSDSRFIIQTRQALNPIIEAALHRDYASFYHYEINKRKTFAYPPYSYLAIIKIAKTNDKLAQQKAEALAKKLSATKDITLLGPSPSFYYKYNNKYSWQIVIKAKKRSSVLKACLLADGDFTIDIDPVNLL